MVLLSATMGGLVSLKVAFLFAGGATTSSSSAILSLVGLSISLLGRWLSSIACFLDADNAGNDDAFGGQKMPGSWYGTGFIHVDTPMFVITNVMVTGLIELALVTNGITPTNPGEPTTAFPEFPEAFAKMLVFVDVSVQVHGAGVFV